MKKGQKMYYWRGKKCTCEATKAERNLVNLSNWKKSRIDMGGESDIEGGDGKGPGHARPYMLCEWI